ncbi:hypothetical protein [Streptomyces sp. T028]|uniref:hypothetical protein n=1 Tax=Streptomyces sp. T028 TaxID=3394379 RepID=UPI003A842BD9
MTVDIEPTTPAGRTGQQARPHFLRVVLRRPSAVVSLAVLTLVVLAAPWPGSSRPTPRWRRTTAR